MSRNDDELDGYADLSERQRAAVDRYVGRSGRFQRDRRPTTNTQAWEAFDTEQARIEQRDIRRGGGR